MDLDIHKISSYYLVFVFTRTFSKGEDWDLIQIKKEEWESNQQIKHKIYFPF